MSEGTLIRVAAGILVREGRILVALRRQDDALGGYWEFPGGKLEPGESAEACLVREFREEFEMTVEAGEFVHGHRFPYKDKEYELLAYWVRSEMEPVALNAHDAVAWLAPGDLLAERLAPADVPIAECILRLGVPVR